MGVNPNRENKAIDIVGDGLVINVEVLSKVSDLLLMSYDVFSKELKADEAMSLEIFGDTVDKELGYFSFKLCI